MGRNSEIQETLQLVDGKLVPFREICLVHAEETFKARVNLGDTDPMIVQMIHLGELIPHWYYRSVQWIDQPYFFPFSFLQPYVGPTNLAISSLYGPDTYIISHEDTIRARRLYCQTDKVE